MACNDTNESRFSLLFDSFLCCLTIKSFQFGIHNLHCLSGFVLIKIFSLTGMINTIGNINMIEFGY